MTKDHRRSPDEHFQRMRKEISDLVVGELVCIVTDVEDAPPERFKNCQIGLFGGYDETNATLYLAPPMWREVNPAGVSTDLREKEAFALKVIREVRQYRVDSTTLIDGYFDDRRDHLPKAD
ncbi:TPA: hypothetical protein HA241_03485 [Candidatus Woesearchaeota archaeon]|nr:hypothetical protein [Candidatus Woesearchaeota archaeon]